MKPIKNWLHDWSLIDMVAFGIGIALTLSFIWYRSRFPNKSSALVDLWPNIATEIVGVWLSVRVIDALIRKREARHNIRREIVGNLAYFLDVARRLSPHFDEWRVQDMREELIWFDRRWHERKKYLSSDEQEDVVRVVLSRREIVNKAQEYVGLSVRIDDLDSRITEARRAINEQRDYVDAIDRARWFREVEKEYDRFIGARLRYDSKLSDCVNDSRFEFEKEKGDWGPRLVPLFQEYLDAIQRLVVLRLDVEEKIREHERLIETARRNVFEESRPY